MNIIHTKIPDIDLQNLDKAKVNLANKTIQNIHPLFDEVRTTKISNLDKLKVTLTEKKRKVIKEKNELEHLLIEYKKSKKIKRLLNRIIKMVESGLVYDSSLRNETVILLKMIESLSEEKLDQYLHDTLTNITKRFGNR